MRTRAIVLCALSLCGIARAARAEKCPQSATGKHHWNQGIDLYNLGKYDEAIRLLEQAYLECRDPDLLFNVGQAYRKLGNESRKLEHLEKARDRFKAWLREIRYPDPTDVTYVEDKLKELNELIDKAKASAEAPPEGLQPREGTGARGGETRSTTALPPIEPTPTTPEESRPWTSDTWGWALAGTGVAALLVGGGLVAWSYGLEDDARATVDEDQANALFDDAETTRTIGAVTMIAGGALLASGVVHFALFGRSARQGEASASVGPGWITLAWSF